MALRGASENVVDSDVNVRMPGVAGENSSSSSRAASRRDATVAEDSEDDVDLVVRADVGVMGVGDVAPNVAASSARRARRAETEAAA